MENKNKLTIEDLHRFVWNTYTSQVDAAMLIIFPLLATVIALSEALEHGSYGVLFYICSTIFILGVIGNILYYRSAYKNKKRIEKLIHLTFPNYEKKYHNLLLKAYEEIREKELGRVNGEEEILLIKNTFDKKIDDYKELVKEACST